MLFDFLLAMLPGMAWLAWFLHKDRYEPEPRGLVAKAFCYGMAAMAISQFAERWLDGALAAAIGREALPRWAALAVVIAPLEEWLKYAVVRLRFYPDPEFNEPMDGIVYATTVAIGFSTLENAIYMYRVGAGVLVFRAVASTMLHLGCSGLIGYALGRLKFSRHKLSLVPWALGVAVAMHAAFDLLVTYAPSGSSPMRSVLALAALSGFLFWLYSYLDLRIDESLARSPFRPGAAKAGKPHSDGLIMSPPAENAGGHQAEGDPP